MERLRVDLVEDDRLATLRGRLAKRMCDLEEAELVLIEARVDELIRARTADETATSKRATL